jgi:hypothetical protein
MKNSRSLLLSVLAVLFFFALVNLGMDLQAQFMARDPGPRGGKVGAGQPVSGLTANQMGFFSERIATLPGSGFSRRNYFRRTRERFRAYV